MAVSWHQFSFGVIVSQIAKFLSRIGGIPLLLHHRKGLAFFSCFNLIVIQTLSLSL